MSATTKLTSESGLSRRSFLRVSATAAGGLIVALYFDFPAQAQAPQPKIYPPDAFVHIQRDGKIVIQVNRLEFGQEFRPLYRCCWPMRWTPTGRKSWPNSPRRKMSIRIPCLGSRWLAARARLHIR